MNIIYVLKNPDAQTRAIIAGAPDVRAGWEQMEESDFIAWRDAQPEITIASPIPQSCAPDVFRVALLQANPLWTDTFVTNSLPTEILKTVWGWRTSYERTHPIIAAVQAALALTDSEMDALFVAANQTP